jgi:hypothetical protein
MRRVLLVALVIGCISATIGHAQSAREARPNVVLIISDELGWADLGSYGATDIRTPNLVRLASECLRPTDFYANGSTLTFNFLTASLAQELSYTIGWAVFAIGMLIAGIALHVRGARIAALALLFITILKCFLHDLGRLGGLYRVGSLLGLAISLVLVGLLLQKFVMLKRPVSSEQ